MPILNELSVKRFLNCFIGSGKSSDVLLVLEKHVKDGKTVCLVVGGVSKQVYEELHLRNERFAPYKDKIDILTVDSLLKKFSDYNITEYRAPERLNKQADDVNFHLLPSLEKYDHILVSHDAYEYIIGELITRLDKMVDLWKRI